MRPKVWIVRVVWTAVVMLVVIALLAVLHRAVALTFPALVSRDSVNPAVGLDTVFERHRLDRNLFAG